MGLEDHIGDIVKKACLVKGIEFAAAAKALRMDYKDFKNFLDSGRTEVCLDYDALGNLFGLSASKIKRLIEGWQPHFVDLSGWNICRLESRVILNINCYLLRDRETREAALFDTGFDFAGITKSLDENKFKLKYVFVTHGHYDHRELIPELMKAFPDIKYYNIKEGSSLNDGEEFRLGRLIIKSIHVPTHSYDSFAYYINGFSSGLPPVVFTGDIIFAGSVGRITCPPGEKGLKMIKEKILGLPCETVICPGHGPVTTVGEELQNNPFF